MKITFLIFFSMICSIGYSQLQPSTIVLKSGEKLTNVLAKIKGHTVKYKENEEAKAKEIEFADIDYFKTELGDAVRTFKFLENDDYNPTDHEQLIAVELLVKGKVELYAVTSNYNAAGGMGMGGTGMTVSQSVSTYYVRKATDKKLTTLGPYSPLTNNLKQRVIDYFSDCKIVVDKLKNSEFRVREGLEKIAQCYNENCGSEKVTPQ